MNTLDRRELMIRALAERGTLSVHRAIQLTEAGEATIRRDMAFLAAQGIGERVRGGIRRAKGTGMTPYAMRAAQLSQEKEAIAQRAAALLKPGDVVFIDGGSTTFHVGACLPQIPLRIITNSLRLASHLDGFLGDHPELEVFLTGGLLHPMSGLLVGVGAQTSLAQYHADWAFLSVGGLTEDGLFNTSEQVVESERMMIARSDRVAVLADHSKIGRHAMCHVCGLDAIDLLITDQQSSSETARSKLHALGLEIVAVELASETAPGGLAPPEAKFCKKVHR